MHSCVAGPVAWTGTGGAIVNGKFFEVGKNRQREFGAPSILVELKGGGGVHADIYTAFFGFDVKLLKSADAESVVR